MMVVIAERQSMTQREDPNVYVYHGQLNADY
jgi:hypothetical protein